MAGFEVIVRPVVFPNIRPAPARALAPEDNPDQGIAAISGLGGRLIDLQHNFSISTTKSRNVKEVAAVVDEARVHQVEPDGRINRSNYIDVEVVNRLALQRDPTVSGGTPGTGRAETSISEYYGIADRKADDPAKNRHIDILKRNMVRKNPAT